MRQRPLGNRRGQRDKNLRERFAGVHNPSRNPECGHPAYLSGDGTTQNELGGYQGETHWDDQGEDAQWDAPYGRSRLKTQQCKRKPGDAQDGTEKSRDCGRDDPDPGSGLAGDSLATNCEGQVPALAAGYHSAGERDPQHDVLQVLTGTGDSRPGEDACSNLDAGDQGSERQQQGACSALQPCELAGAAAGSFR